MGTMPLVGIAKLLMDFAAMLAGIRVSLGSLQMQSCRHDRDATYLVESALCRAETENFLPEKLILSNEFE